jgi:hypothetical protein
MSTVTIQQIEKAIKPFAALTHNVLLRVVMFERSHVVAHVSKFNSKVPGNILKSGKLTSVIRKSIEASLKDHLITDFEVRNLDEDTD